MRKLEDNIRREIEGYIGAGMSLDAAVDHVRRNRQGRLGMMIDMAHSAIAASLMTQGQSQPSSVTKIPTFLDATLLSGKDDTHNTWAAA